MIKGIVKISTLASCGNEENPFFVVVPAAKNSVSPSAAAATSVPSSSKPTTMPTTVQPIPSSVSVKERAKSLIVSSTSNSKNLLPSITNSANSLAAKPTTVSEKKEIGVAAPFSVPTNSSASKSDQPKIPSAASAVPSSKISLAECLKKVQNGEIIEIDQIEKLDDQLMDVFEGLLNQVSISSANQGLQRKMANLAHEVLQRKFQSNNLIDQMTDKVGIVKYLKQLGVDANANASTHVELLPEISLLILPLKILSSTSIDLAKQKQMINDYSQILSIENKINSGKFIFKIFSRVNQII